MALDRVMIGDRIRKIREDIFEESRKEFAKRCDLEYRHLAQLERGEFLFSLPTLDKIATATGTKTDYILYGKKENNKLKVTENLYALIDRADTDELQMYFKCLTSIKHYMNKKDKDKNKGEK